MKTIAFLLMLFALASCQTYYYYPTYQHIPSNEKKNEIKAAYFADGYNEGFSLGYSLNNYLGLFTNINTFNEYDFKDGTHLSDLGLFYYKNIKVPQNKNIGVTVSLSSAYSYGRYKSQEFNMNLTDLGINRAYIQPSFSLTSRFVDLGMSYRFSYVDYNIKTEEASSYKDLLDVGDEPFYFAEPHLFVGLGYKWIKLNYHFTSLQKLNSAKILFYEENGGYLSLSIKYDIDKIFNKSKDR